MSGKITDVFRQRKSSAERSGSGHKAFKEPELQGASGAAAVTNTDISQEERQLREFDLDTRFGPCAGMTRLERWDRAEKFGLSPPQAVKELLLRLEGDHWNKSLWDNRQLLAPAELHAALWVRALQLQQLAAAGSNMQRLQQWDMLEQLSFNLLEHSTGMVLLAGPADCTFQCSQC